MKTHWQCAAVLGTCLASLATAQAPTAFESDLLFRASFDQSPDADLAKGEARVAAATPGEFVEGKYGRGLHFKAGSKSWCEYAAKGNIRPDQGTIAFHFKPDWSGEEFVHRYFFLHPGPRNRGGGANFADSLGVQTMKYRKPVQEVWIWYDDHGGGNNTAHGSIADWRAGEWRHVAVTWDAQWLCVYLDGELKGRSRVRGTISDPGATFFVGSSRNGSMASGGVMDEFCIYGRALSASEVGILSGRADLVRPRIHSLTLDQSLYFPDEPSIRFRFSLGGRIDTRQHRLEVALAAQSGGPPLASARLPASQSRHALSLPRGLREGGYALRASLVDSSAVLDTRTVPVYVVASPYAATQP